mgnify:CR=1 FL=1
MRRCGELGLLGLTVGNEVGGSALDPVAAVIVHHELAKVDPGFTLSYLAHALLFVNNLAINGSEAQRAKYLPDACSGAKIGGMCMSEPGAGSTFAILFPAARLRPLLTPLAVPDAQPATAVL